MTAKPRLLPLKGSYYKIEWRSPLKGKNCNMVVAFFYEAIHIARSLMRKYGFTFKEAIIRDRSGNVLLIIRNKWHYRMPCLWIKHRTYVQSQPKRV